jgi:hypothetical protein
LQKNRLINRSYVSREIMRGRLIRRPVSLAMRSRRSITSSSVNACVPAVIQISRCAEASSSRTAAAMIQATRSFGTKSTMPLGAKGHTGNMSSSVVPHIRCSPWKLLMRPFEESPTTMDGRRIVGATPDVMTSRSAARLDSAYGSDRPTFSERCRQWM